MICTSPPSPLLFWKRGGGSSTTGLGLLYKDIPIVQGIEYRPIESKKIWPKSRSSCCDSNLSI